MDLRFPLGIGKIKNYFNMKKILMPREKEGTGLPF